MSWTQLQSSSTDRAGRRYPEPLVANRSHPKEVPLGMAKCPDCNPSAWGKLMKYGECICKIISSLSVSFERIRVVILINFYICNQFHLSVSGLYRFCFALPFCFFCRDSARRMRTQPKERNHKRKGFAPPLKVPLF